MNLSVTLILIMKDAMSLIKLKNAFDGFLLLMEGSNLMMPFSTGLGWSVSGVVGLDLDSC